MTRAQPHSAPAPPDRVQQGTFWSGRRPPAEFRGLLVAVVALCGIPALALVVLEGLRSAGTLAAVGVIALSLLLSVTLVRRGESELDRRTGILVQLFGSVALIAAVVLSQNPLSVMATSVPFGFTVAWSRPRWLPVLVGLAAIAVATAVTNAMPAAAMDARDIVMMGIYFGAAVLGFAGSAIGWQMQRQMDRFHADQNDLSLARERLRFATDLHDIQGHTLLAIKMKAELARRSLDRDPERVLRELEDIEGLAAEAGVQTRRLAQGYRTLTLAGELANLDQLLGAAGIAVRIERHGSPDSEHEELLATLVREAASNILRHADPEQVVLEIAPTSVRIRNDGTLGGTADPDGGSGLIGLRRRFRTAGGEVAWGREDTVFVVLATIGDAA